MSDQISLFVAQLQSTDDIEKNLEQILDLLSPISRQVQESLVCLPENALYLRLREGEKIQGLTLEHLAFSRLARLAKEKNLVLHIGSVPMIVGSKLGNCSVLIRSSGEMKVSYQKIHLFDIELEGQKPIRESDVFDRGQQESCFNFSNWKIGQTICYDLRFSELFLRYAKAEVDAILVPAAFLKTTGEAHWHVLLRARAIESQCFVIAAAQAGEHRSESGVRFTYGHSLVIDPWGRILAEGSSSSPELISVVLDQEANAKVRRQIPMKNHRSLAT